MFSGDSDLNSRVNGLSGVSLFAHTVLEYLTQRVERFRLNRVGTGWLRLRRVRSMIRVRFAMKSMPSLRKRVKSALHSGIPSTLHLWSFLSGRTQTVSGGF